MSFITDTISGYTTFIGKHHTDRDKYMKDAKEGDTAATLQMLDNTQTESRYTGLIVNVISKQDEILKKPIDAMR